MKRRSKGGYLQQSLFERGEKKLFPILEREKGPTATIEKGTKTSTASLWKKEE